MNKNKKINKLLKTKSKKKNGHVKFYDYIMKNYHKKSNFLTLEEGMKSLKIVNSIYKSSTKNTPFLINKVRDTFLGNKKNLMKIDFNNIYRQDKILFNKIIRDIKKIIKKSNFILGDEVKKFENNFAKFTKTKYCVGCANGSDALYLAIKSLNLKSSDEIIIPDMTYVATASAVVNNRCKLRIADVNLENASIKQDEVIRKINKNTKAIIIVNLWGFTASYKKLKKICKQKNIFLIEDAAQSIGSYNSDGINSGNIGDIACFSFFP